MSGSNFFSTLQTAILWRQREIWKSYPETLGENASLVVVFTTLYISCVCTTDGSLSPDVVASQEHLVQLKQHQYKVVQYSCALSYDPSPHTIIIAESAGPLCGHFEGAVIVKATPTPGSTILRGTGEPLLQQRLRETSRSEEGVQIH